jgi:hypothetical protein
MMLFERLLCAEQRTVNECERLGQLSAEGGWKLFWGDCFWVGPEKKSQQPAYPGIKTPHQALDLRNIESNSHLGFRVLGFHTASASSGLSYATMTIVGN